MDAIEALKTRRSCRHFTNEQLRQEDLQSIIDCGLNAPSALNRQITKIVVIQDQETIDMLSKINSKVAGRDTDEFYGAKTICLIMGPKDSGYEEEAYQLNTVKDASLVLGAMQTAAFAIGVGSCWINRCAEMLETEEGKKILNELHLEDYQGVGCCILGYPSRTLKPKKIKEDRVLYYKAEV